MLYISDSFWPIKDCKVFRIDFGVLKIDFFMLYYLALDIVFDYSPVKVLIEVVKPMVVEPNTDKNELGK